MEQMMQFGVAGLMGALWVWERAHSRKRERELSEAHQMLMRRDEHLDVLMRMVRRNTRTMVRFEQIMKRMVDLLTQFKEERDRNEKAA